MVIVARDDPNYDGDAEDFDHDHIDNYYHEAGESGDGYDVDDRYDHIDEKDDCYMISPKTALGELKSLNRLWVWMWYVSVPW